MRVIVIHELIYILTPLKEGLGATRASLSVALNVRAVVCCNLDCSLIEVLSDL